MNLKPTTNRVLVKPDPKQEMVGSIVIPDTVRDKNKIEKGIVVGLPDKILSKNGTEITCEIALGDHIMYSKFSGNDLSKDGETLAVIRYEDIEGVLYND